MDHTLNAPTADDKENSSSVSADDHRNQTIFEVLMDSGILQKFRDLSSEPDGPIKDQTIQDLLRGTITEIVSQASGKAFLTVAMRQVIRLRFSSDERGKPCFC